MYVCMYVIDLLTLLSIFFLRLVLGASKILQDDLKFFCLRLRCPLTYCRFYDGIFGRFLVLL